MKTYLFLFTALLVFVSCKNTPDKNTAADIQGIDSSIKPGDNFFMYVNRKWYDSAQIPPSQSGVGTYMFMNYPQRLRLQGMLDSVAHAGNSAGGIEQKLGDFYASGMDTNTINQRGYEPLKTGLDRINGINSIAEMIAFIADQTKLSNAILLSFQVSPDQENSSVNMGHIS